jgi:hypothetical protein
MGGIAIVLVMLILLLAPFITMLALALQPVSSDVRPQKDGPKEPKPRAPIAVRP